MACRTVDSLLADDARLFHVHHRPRDQAPTELWPIVRSRFPLVNQSLIFSRLCSNGDYLLVLSRLGMLKIVIRVPN